MIAGGCNDQSTSLAVCGEKIAGEWLTTEQDWITTFAVAASLVAVSTREGPEPDTTKYDLMIVADDEMTLEYRVTSRDESRCELALEVTYPPPNEQYTAFWIMTLNQPRLCWQQIVGDWEGPEQCYTRL